MIEQPPLDGILAPARVTLLAELLSVPVPEQVVVGAGDIWMLKFAGTVSVKPDCVRSKPFALLNVMVSVAGTFSPTLVGENASVIVGGAGLTVSGVGHAVVAVPGDDGA